MLTVRHLGHAQSERIIWLCEELAMAPVEARLGEAEHLAGREFTAADIMSVFSLTTMRLFQPVDLRPYPNQHPGLLAADRGSAGLPPRDGQGGSGPGADVDLT